MKLQMEVLENKHNQAVPVEGRVAQDEISFHGDSLPIEKSITASGTAVYTGDNIQVTLDISAQVEQHCRRCLDPVTSTIKRHEVIEFRPDMNLDIASEGSVSIYNYQGEEEIDLDPIILSFIQLDLEPYPLCKPDCNGLCSHCGANLNDHPEHDCQESETKAKDPRMEKLAELL